MDTRSEDLKQLRQAYKTATPVQRRHIERSANRIHKETALIRSMREALVKAHRDGNHGNIKDIHAYIERKQQYQNE